MTLLQSGLAKSAAADAYTVDQSLRLNAADTPYLIRTPGTGNRKTWSVSFWAKLTKADTSTYGVIWSACATAASLPGDVIIVETGDANWRFWIDGSSEGDRDLQAVARDPSSWYHVVCFFDSPNQTMGMYINGELQTAMRATGNPTLNYDSDTFDGSTPIRIGEPASTRAGDDCLDCYVAEFHMVDGQALTASDFGETSATTNQWVPKEYEGTYGDEGFYLKFASTELADSFTDSSDPTAFTPTEDLTCQVLVVGGGGGSATKGSACGGGGAGGLVYVSSYAVTEDTDYAITVGAGAASAVGTATAATDGADSVFDVSDTTQILTASGGGGGSSNGSDANDGGSGGGGSNDNLGYGAYGSSDQVTTFGSYSGVGFGFRGGAGTSTYSMTAAGGGGAGAIGSAPASTTVGGAGGVGKDYSSVFGTGVGASGWFAGGGGGAGNTAGGGAGGTGGGGAGGTYPAVGTAGSTNTGGGAGGSSADANPSAAGGSGVVIVRYAGSVTKATGGTISTITVDGSDYKIHVFTSSRSPHTITANGDTVNTRAVRKVGDSSIYFDGTGDYLSIPQSDEFAVGSGDFTIETWIRPDLSDSSRKALYTTTDNTQSPPRAGLRFIITTTGIVEFYGSTVDSSTDTINFNSTAGDVVTDVWQHIAAVRDGSTFRCYVDGVQVGTYSITNTSYSIPAPGAWWLGRSEDYYSTQYIDEYRFSTTCRYPDGTTFTPSTTEFTADADTKLLIHSNWTGGLGADSSGNYNEFTVNNLVATDQVKDSPTNNFCTMSPLIVNAAYTYSEGNLKVVGGTVQGSMYGTMGATSGKWYWESFLEASDNGVLGFTTFEDIMKNNPYYPGYYTPGYAKQDTNYYYNETSSTGEPDIDEGDIMNVAVDVDSGKCWFGINGVWDTGDPATGATPTFTNANITSCIASGRPRSATVVWNFGQDSSFAGAKTAQGNQDENEIGDFYYTPPSGFLAMCSSNLPAPSIKKPGVNFNTILYDDGAGAKTGVGFQPDLVWVKSRGSTYEHEWTDAVRGVTEALSSDSTNAETTDSTGLTAFGTDGFTVGADTNYSDTTGSGMVAWSWKAGTTFDPATAGSVVTGSGSSNATAGFSTVGYEGTGSAMTIGHGLSQAPDLIIVKNRDAADAWQVYCSSNTAAPETDYLVLNTNAATVDNVDRWNDTAPTSSVFTVGDGVEVNTDDENYIAYCFHSIEGYSKVGSYEGNGNADGSFVYTGFRPAFVITKSIDSTSDWQMFDDKRIGYNVDNYELEANDNAVEDTSTEFIDIVSNGFKNRIATDPNVAETYLYIAFAESPFKYANAR